MNFTRTKTFKDKCNITQPFCNLLGLIFQPIKTIKFLLKEKKNEK